MAPEALDRLIEAMHTRMDSTGESFVDLAVILIRAKPGDLEWLPDQEHIDAAFMYAEEVIAAQVIADESARNRWVS